MKTRSLLNSFCCLFLFCFLVSSCSRARYNNRVYVKADPAKEKQDQRAPKNQKTQDFATESIPPVSAPEFSVALVPSTPEPVPTSTPALSSQKKQAMKTPAPVENKWVSQDPVQEQHSLIPDRDMERKAGFGLRLVGWILIIAGLICIFTVPLLFVGILLMLLGLLFVVVGIRQRGL